MMATIVLMSTVAAFAGAGVPGSSLITTLIVLNAIGLGPRAAGGDRARHRGGSSARHVSFGREHDWESHRCRLGRAERRQAGVSGQTISEKILSAKSGGAVRPGDIAVCDVDLVIGTDASSPMAIDYFEKMGGERLFDPSRVVFSLDHYSPPSTPKTAAFHDRVRAFAARTGAEVLEVGVGISHQVVAERGRVLPGDLAIGADSHTVTCGALNLFATGVGSSDLAAAMISGRIWLRTPETIKITLSGTRPAGLAAKDAALAIIGELGAEGANYQTLEFHGPAVDTFSLEERFVFSNLAVEAGAKAAIFGVDAATIAYLEGRTATPFVAIDADADAVYAREIVVDLSRLSPRIAVPHSPNDVVEIDAVSGNAGAHGVSRNVHRRTGFRFSRGARHPRARCGDASRRCAARRDARFSRGLPSTHRRRNARQARRQWVRS
jgi:homoaconitase/3-isopropylmalate dehydratase large subunit